MSTRATYSFASQNQPTVKHYVYIHYDGYPEGAALYFYETLMNPSKGNFATQFIRANSNAELTRHHDQHSDTEYCYDITGSGPEANIEAYAGKTCFFSGKLHEFITRYNEMIKGFKPFVEVAYRYNKQFMNVVMAIQALEHPVSHLRAWKGRYEGSGNWMSCVSDARSIVDRFPDLMTEEIKEFILSK